MKRLLTVLGLDYRPSDEPIFTEAFTHRSAVNEKSEFNTHNERLEFLGDAVLELAATEFLYAKFPEKPEGDLTNLRSALVCGAHLSQVARRLRFGDELILSEGEKRSGGAQKDYLLANVTEAFIGAVYLTRGFDAARDFIAENVLPDLAEILRTGSFHDSKSEFQELVQGQVGVTPRYEVLAEEGKDHEKQFTIGAFIEDRQVGVGSGGSKKEAQTAAAADALSKKSEWLPE